MNVNDPMSYYYSVHLHLNIRNSCTHCLHPTEENRSKNCKSNTGHVMIHLILDRLSVRLAASLCLEDFFTGELQTFMELKTLESYS